MKNCLIHVVALLLLALALAACSGARPDLPAARPAPPCVFAEIAGDPFEFLPTYAGGERFGYYGWKTQPDAARRLPYFPYVGRRGKLTPEIVASAGGLYQKAILENCEVVYAETNREFPAYQGALLTKDLARARGLIGRPIWSNNALVARNLDLITADPRRSYPVRNLERLMVTGVVLEQYAHASGAGSFFLKVRKATGEEGLLRFNDQYFHESDPLPADTPPEIRRAVEEKKIRTGMTAQQVLLSWGRPKKVSRTAASLGDQEQWEYETHTLDFTNGRVSAFRPAR